MFQSRETGRSLAQIERSKLILDPHYSLQSQSCTMAEDLQRANNAWTIVDAAASAKAVEARHHNRSGDDGEEEIMTQELSINPSQPHVVIELDRGIRKFWNRYKMRFTILWVGMDQEAKRRLFLTIAPDMAKTRNDRNPNCAGQLVLLPEFILKDLISNNDAIMKIITNVITKDLVIQYQEDTQLIRRLIRQGKLQPDNTAANRISLLEGGKFPGETMMINASQASSGHMQKVQESFDKMIATGLAVEGPVFSLVIRRRHNFLVTLALLFDEIRNEAFKADAIANKDVTVGVSKIMLGTLKCSNPTCEKTRANNGGPLKQCSKCLSAQYCGRNCQKKHLPTHRQVCGKKVNDAGTTKN